MPPLPVYVINLSSRPDRLAHMQDQANSLGFTFSRIAAVDGHKPEFIEAFSSHSPRLLNGPPLRPPEVACFMSHRLAWQQIANGKAQFGCVMEDDLVFMPDFGRILIPDWIPSDADIVRAETTGTMVRLERRPAAVVGGRKVLRMLTLHHGAGAYILSKQAAHRLLAETVEIGDPVDQILFNSGSPLADWLRIYQFCPAPAIQGSVHEEGSDLGWAKSTLQFARAETAKLESATDRRWRLIYKRIKRARGKIKSNLTGKIYMSVPFG